MSVMARSLRRAAVGVAFVTTLVLLIWLLPRLLKPPVPDDDSKDNERDKYWVNSSPYWIDRQACRWLSLCGIQHLRWDAPALPDDGSHSMLEAVKMLALGWSTSWIFVEKTGASDWETAPAEKDWTRAVGANGPPALQEVPDYVLAHAPLVHLYSGENFWPSHIGEHITHLRPVENGSRVDGKPMHLGNLASLNGQNGTVFLTSRDDVESRPGWLHNRVGVPVPFDGDEPGGGDGERRGPDSPTRRPNDGTTWWDADRKHPPHRIAPPSEYPEKPRGLQRRGTASNAQQPIVGTGEEDNKPLSSGYSKGPAVLILVDKGAGILDAFWFFFYSYNLGQTVLKIRFGNHVGDWEHCMVRFQHGIPRAMFLSEHSGGKAYAWNALEKRAQKRGKPARPVIYSAVGSHAMYASVGMHPYVLPFKLLKDITDKGPLWDPALNHYAYWYDYEVDRDEAGNSTVQEHTSLTPAASNPDLPTSWFHFMGYWGDDVYPLNDRRQWRLFGEYHYCAGPLGPKAKHLDRRKVCQTEKCTIVDSIEAGKKSAWY